MTPKDMLIKALEMDVCFHSGPSFLGSLRKEINFFIKGNLYNEFERHVKKRPCKRAPVSIGALLGNLEVIHLLGLLWDKENT